MGRFTVNVRLGARRQITLPRKVCEKLRVLPGDTLEVAIEDSALVLKPNRARALNALREIQEAFRRSGITEEELLEDSRKIRKELIKERYG
ncbi:MAG: AbrB/MazE/SpoVT family DNA-binding protein, partial [Dehalococcoidia bacterium]|nr:AbrB/MazE/SpoVT family DNA-binding protein [Dehalococcoidia bacterium]